MFTTLIALLVYWPLARGAALLDRFGLLPSGWPLAWYRDKSLYVMRTDGSEVKQLTFRSTDDSGATWSPDGLKLAFMSHRDGNAEIYVMNANGGNLKRLTNNLATDSRPVWSPDGNRIAFASNRESANPYNFDIYVMNADGTHPTRLTNDPEYDADPSWSPDGKKIAFASARSGEFRRHRSNRGRCFSTWNCAAPSRHGWRRGQRPRPAA